MIKAKVKEIKVSENYIYLKIESGTKLNIQPGQFVMMRIKGFEFPKPFSTVDQKGNYLEFLISVVGEMTSEMKKLKVEDCIEIRGPYGVPFIEKLDKTKKYILLGADSGCAPLMHFKKYYPELVKEEIYGFLTGEIKQVMKGEKFHIDEVEKRTPLEKVAELISENDGILTCGSMEFIKAVKRNFPNHRIYASLEARMVCGIGMCKGCPIKTKNGLKMICKDGPIFDLSEVKLEW